MTLIARHDLQVIEGTPADAHVVIGTQGTRPWFHFEPSRRAYAQLPGAWETGTFIEVGFLYRQ